MSRVHVNYTAYAKMLHYARWAPGEISGFGKTQLWGNWAEGKLIQFSHAKVLDAMILSQSCSGGYTELDENAVTDFLVTLAEKRKDPQDYSLWWHSHSTFGVFWSSVDEANIQRLCQSTPWVSLCINKAGDMVARYDYGTISMPLRVTIEPTCSQYLIPKVRREVSMQVSDRGDFDADQD